MKDQAIAKLKAEMDGAKSNEYIRVVGQYLTGYIEANPEAAEKIMAADKTIAKSLDAMRNEAQKKKVGNVAMFTPQQGFEIVMKYFGINGAAAVPAQPAQTPVVTLAAAFDVSLDDLLGG